MAANSSSPVIIQWILDTRSLWPEATQTSQLETVASRALALLTEEERAGVQRYVHVRDAKMSLGSHLLKHFVVGRYCQVPWRETKITRDSRTKPIYRDPATGECPVSFNVSHQAGIVALAGVFGYDGTVDVGVDVVCPSERRHRDHKMVAEEGWVRFVDMHADVFAPGEARYLNYQILSAAPGLPPGSTPEGILDFKLRCFYTLWCLREAYVKMTGEALLAEWLGVLEFRNFRPPKASPAFGQQAGEEEEEEDSVVRDHNIWFRGSKVDDANVCLRSLGLDYMTCTAIRTPDCKADGLGFDLGPFEILSIDEILDLAESRM